MKRIFPTLVVALAATATAVAASGSSSNQTTLDLALDGRHATRTYVDAAPRHTRRAPNDSPGDTVVLHAPLLDSKGTRVGTIDATFLTTAPGTSAKHDGSEQLTATLTLADRSQLAVQGVVGAFARTTHIAIVGGTGKYAGARGQVTAHFTPRAVRLHLELS
jgi:Dirigent-like protein